MELLFYENKSVCFGNVLAVSSLDFPHHEVDFVSEVLLQKNVKHVSINCPSLSFRI
jgi:hypothetical protein